MKMQMTNKLLADISKDISGGRPLWGLLRANEYLESDSPVRKALVFKAKGLISEDVLSEPVQRAVEPILSGSTLTELPLDIQVALRKDRELSTRPVKGKHSYLPTRTVRFSERKASLRALRAA